MHQHSDFFPFSLHSFSFLGLCIIFFFVFILILSSTNPSPIYSLTNSAYIIIFFSYALYLRQKEVVSRLFFYCFIKIISSSASTCNYTTNEAQQNETNGKKKSIQRRKNDWIVISTVVVIVCYLELMTFSFSFYIFIKSSSDRLSSSLMDGVKISSDLAGMSGKFIFHMQISLRHQITQY